MIRLPGDELLWQLEPALPLAKTLKMPDASQAALMSSMNGALEGPSVPQELLTMFGRLPASGFSPSRSVGSSIHCPDSIRASSLGQQPLAAIHLAPGATPIWFSPPSSPIIVPIVWVPWLNWRSMSHG